ncbi:MAG: recombinase family protein, partial [Limnospira maxima]
MKILAYSYTEPLLEPPPDPTIWGWDIDGIYQDFGDRQQLEQMLEDCQQLPPPNYLLIQRYEELGNSVLEVSDRLRQLQQLNIQVIAIESDLKSSDISRVDLIKFIFIPHEQSAASEKFDSQKVALLPAICILFIALIFANLPYYESTYT